MARAMKRRLLAIVCELPGVDQLYVLMGYPMQWLPLEEARVQQQTQGGLRAVVSERHATAQEIVSDPKTMRVISLALLGGFEDSLLHEIDSRAEPATTPSAPCGESS